MLLHTRLILTVVPQPSFFEYENMKKTNFVHVSENAFFSQEGKLSVIGIFDKIITTRLPVVQPGFAISLNVTSEVGTHKVKVEIVSPDNKLVVSVGGMVEVKNTEGGANFIANLVGVPFVIAGKYVVKVFLDDEIIDEGTSIVIEYHENV